ncbi:NAD/NADP octopine/nopaline dehydrogenase family protein [Erysipelothrix rhusiopathiae]|nr:NAD/NADP octopine/nopaline dehydrogenase family protein [Erysipelothrix rhusiopathiae]
MKNIAIIGGGNGAHAAAADLTLKGFSVNLIEDARFKHHMQTVFDTFQIHVTGVVDGIANLKSVTTDLQKGIEDAEIIIVAVPAFAHKDYAYRLAPCLKEGQTVFIVPGTFGSLIFKKAMEDVGNQANVAFAEAHTLPYATRIIKPGHVMIMSRFNPLKVGVLPAKETIRGCHLLSELYDGIQPVESVVACGLNSLNPVIHVPGCILNAGRIEKAQGEFYFYTEGFTSCVVRTTEILDQERIRLLEAFGYNSETVNKGVGGPDASDDLHKVISENPSFASIKGPADVKGRYYSEDIPFGLATWAKFASHLNIEAPVMDSLVTLGSSILEKDCWSMGPSMEDLGLKDLNIQQIKAFIE